jgi:hypothetical protein
LNIINNEAKRFVNLSLDWISRHRFSILVTFLFIRFLSFASNGFWSGDFWEHSAVVKELIERPLLPQHPLFLLDTPNAFMSPYALLVATFARLLSLSAIDALSIFSLVNFLLLAYGAKRFCSVISPKYAESTAFYFILLTLMLWGNNPWPYSGFFHIEIIETVLPYPSTFSIALSLIGLSLFLKPINTYKVLSNSILCLIIWTVLLSHPLTFIFLSSGLFFLSFSSDSFPFKKLFTLGCLILIACVTALFWPYFSLYDLLVGGSKVYHTSNLVMYLNVWERVWPNLFLIPFFLLVLRTRLTVIISLWFIALCLIYAYGTLSSNYSYGRIISYCILLAHVIAAYGLTRFEFGLQKTHINIIKTYHLLLISTLLALSLTWLPSTVTRLLTIGNQISKNKNFVNQISYKNLVFIKNFINPDQLVLADIETSWMVPTFGGRVIAALHPQAFVPDTFDRQRDINMFFSTETNKEQRIEMINKYRPQFLLLDLSKPTASQIERDLSQFIEPINTNDRYRLFRLL